MRKLAIFSVAIFLLVAVAGANPLLEGYAAPKDKRQLKAATSTVPLYKPTALRGWSLRGLGDSANGAK